MRRRRDRPDHASARPANAGKPGFEKEVAKRTLTNLYNQRPAWLARAHETLAVAYGWTDYTNAMPDDDILRRLLALNLERSSA